MLKQFTVLLFIFGTLVSRAQDASFNAVPNVPELKTKIQNTHKNSKTVKSLFTQEKHLSFMQDKVTSKGIFQLKHPGKMRIEYTSPFAYLVIINGEKIMVKDGKKVTKIDTRTDKSFRQLNAVLTHSLNGEIDNIKGFEAQFLQSKDYYLVNLTPSEAGMKDLFDKIKIYLDHTTLQVAKLDLLEKSGDVTKMKFEQIQTNVTIPDETFVAR